jgi:hypothetical protein
MVSLRGSCVACLLLAAGPGCRTAVPKPPPAPSPAPPPTAGLVEKTRDELQVAPWDMVFSGVRGAAQVSETVNARNLVDHVVEVRAIMVLGESSSLFAVRDLPTLPARVSPRARISAAVVFAPAKDAPLGVHRALLRFQTGPTSDDGPGVDLAALVTRGAEGDGEPPLQQVVDVLGFSVDVGNTGLKLGTGEAAIGSETRAPLFQRAKSAPVALNPVGRFSASQPLPFGYYTGSGAETVTHEMGVLEAAQSQTLNPEMAAGGQTSFDPGEQTFGIWVRAGNQALYTEDQRNRGAVRHAVRVFPLRSRGGAPVADAFLLAFEDGGNGDYQDYVFVLWNAKPAVGP